MSHPNDVIPEVPSKPQDEPKPPSQSDIQKFLDERRRQQIERLKASGIFKEPGNTDWIGKR